MNVIPFTVLAIGVVLSGCRNPRSQADALSRAELGMNDVATLPQQQVEARLPKSHGAVYYGYAARLFREGRKEEAVFWFYVGQLRFRFDVAAHPDADPSGGPALLASLNSSIGADINEWAAKDTDLWQRQINRALQWDATHPNSVTSKAAYKKEYKQVRHGLERMREEIVSRSNGSAESKSATRVAVRKVGGVPVIEMSGNIDRVGVESALKALRRAEGSKAGVVVFVIDSPGGEIFAVLKLADGIGRAKCRTYGLVERAFGGAVFLVATLDVLYFTRNGVCGSAVQVLSGSYDSSFLITKLKSLASANGHDPEVFGAMIDADAELVRGTNVWKAKRHILSLTAREAIILGISDGYCDSAEGLVKKITEKQGEQDGAANGSQPVRSGTSSTSGAAGSRR